MTQIDLPLRSVSQINQFTKCPMAYKLARIDKVWSRPAAWLPQGTAFHTVAEEIEKRAAAGAPMSLEEAKAMFGVEYAKDISAMTDTTPNFEWWQWSGPYAGERDVTRRYGVGIEQVEKFMAWREMVGQEIWMTPDMCELEHDCENNPKPAIELAFKIDLDGILVRGFVDAVVVVDGKPRVRDYKTGADPGDDFQLAVYALAIEMLYGVKVETGDYFMAGKSGKKPRLVGPYDLTLWTRERITERFHEVEAEIQAGEFEARPEASKCRFCDVSYSCPELQA